MPLVKRLIGTILQSGSFFEARPKGRPGQFFPNEGEARAFFRRFVGTPQPLVPTRMTSGGASVSYVGDIRTQRKIDVYLTSFEAPPPPPPPDPPDLANRIVYGSRIGPFWQDAAKTIRAVVGGVDPVWVWETTGAGDFVWDGTGTIGTLAADGKGITFPTGGTSYTSTAAAAGTFSLYVCCDPHTPAAPNIVACSSSAQASFSIQPLYTGTSAYVVSGAGNDFVTDENVEATRGIAIAGTDAVIFAGEVEKPDTLGASSIASLRLGTTLPGVPFQGTIRAVLLYNVKHDAPMRAQVRSFLATTDVPQVTMQVLTHLHFEGTDGLLGPEKAALDAFQALHPDVVLTQGWNAMTFFLGAGPAVVVARYNALLKPGDEVANHFHGQYTWITPSPVTPRSLDTYTSTTIPSALGGYDVTMSSYTGTEYQQLVTFQLDNFSTNGAPRATAHVASAFLTDADTRAGLVAAGITRDLSPVPPALTAPVYGAVAQAVIASEYAGITTTSQPFTDGALLRIPCNGSMLAYGTLAQNREHFFDNVRVKRGTPLQRQIFACGFHFTAYEIGMASDFYTSIKAWAAANKVTLQFVTASAIS
jgi:hypothetical protein